MTDDQQPQVRLDARLAALLESKRAALARHLPLSPDQLYPIADTLRVVLSFHSNAIEGNTLTLQETQRVIDLDEAIPGKTVRELLEAKNHAAGVDAMLELAARDTPLTIADILALHARVMTGLIPTPGAFRTQMAEIAGRTTLPPPPRLVPRLMDEWLEWVNAGGRAHYPNAIVRGAIGHHRFEDIHPFADGNGRVGRLVLNVLLLRAGYAPAVLRKEWRIAYYTALRQADAGQYKTLANMIGSGVVDGFAVYLNEIGRVAELRPLRELADGSGYSQEYLSLLCRRRKIDAVQRRGVWYSTADAIARYAATVERKTYRRGRPRREE